LRARVGDDEIPWDGEAMGELEVRGPWVASAYYETPEQADRWTPDGWFKTGDIVSINPRGFVQIKDRSKDVIKSGGEWISSDVLVRRGRYPQMPELPAVLGSEIAGELDDGTRVMAITSGAGGYAEVAAVDRAQVVPLPESASFAEGASFLLTFLTAFVPLTRQ